MFTYKDDENVRNLKKLIIDSVQNAGSGHLGSSISITPFMYVLFKNFLRNWISVDEKNLRDRFVLSAGHLSLSLYAQLYFLGFKYNLDDFKKYRKLNSKVNGHPELNQSLGIETSSGPLGQGVANSVGMALALHVDNQQNPKLKKYRRKIWCLCSDGDLQEGVTWESINLASQYCLDNLIIVHDSNKITIDGEIDIASYGSYATEFERKGWKTFKIDQVNFENLNYINEVLTKVEKVKKGPVFIEIETVIGIDSPSHRGSPEIHSNPVSEEEYIKICKKLKLPSSLFDFSDNFEKQVHENKLQMLKGSINTKNIKKLTNINKVNLSEVRKFKNLRDALKYSLNLFENAGYKIVGGSADLGKSTGVFNPNRNVIFQKNKNQKFWDYIHFGVREHSMAGIMNGYLLFDELNRFFVSTYLVFSDYLKPALRMSALMDLPALYIFSHDSVFVGGDGPTHQPVEHLDSLRLIPNLTVVRPANEIELINSVDKVIECKKPTALVISRDSQLIETNKNSIKMRNGIKSGIYIHSKHGLNPRIALVASGQEFNLIFEVSKKLITEKIDHYLISVPCINWIKDFEKFQNKISDVELVIIVEASTGVILQNLFSFTKNKLININQFGHSASSDELVKVFNFDSDSIMNLVKQHVS